MNYETSSYHVYLKTGETIDHPTSILLLQQNCGKEIASMYVDSKASMVKWEDNQVAKSLLEQWIIPTCVRNNIMNKPASFFQHNNKNGYFVGIVSKNSIDNRRMIDRAVHFIKSKMPQMSNMYLSFISSDEMKQLQESILKTNQHAARLVK